MGGQTPNFRSNSSRLIVKIQPGYSETSAPLDDTDDIFQSVDDAGGSVLFLLDFNRAFDTVWHDILLATLKSCGVSGEGLNLLCSHLDVHS